MNDTFTVKIKRHPKGEVKTIPVICPWCNSIYNVAKWHVEHNKKIGATHGICPKCFEKIKKK